MLQFLADKENRSIDFGYCQLRLNDISLDSNIRRLVYHDSNLLAKDGQAA